MRAPNEDAPPATVVGIGIGLLVWAPLIVGLALTSWLLLAFTGWGFETSPGVQLARDAPWLAASAATGVGAAAVFCRAVGANVRYWAVGAIPAILRASAYFTNLY